MTPFSMKYISMDLSLALLAARLFKLQFYVLAEWDLIMLNIDSKKGRLSVAGALR